ncbi:MAG: YaiI/YqxD family protein [Candidatus Fermentibacteraceae bacterium]
MTGDAPDTVVYVDADACPVKSEIYRVARRYELPVVVVSNSWMRVPPGSWVTLRVVEKGEGVADDWIAEAVGRNDIVVTGDIPLARRCIEAGALVMGLRGRPFTAENICAAVATRDLMTGLRDLGIMEGGGPPPFERKDRSRFLEAMDEMVNAVLAGRTDRYR